MARKIHMKFEPIFGHIDRLHVYSPSHDTHPTDEPADLLTNHHPTPLALPHPNDVTPSPARPSVNFDATTQLRLLGIAATNPTV